MNKLSVTKSFDVRFSEVDSMCIVWHGNYMLYFEDAREAFGKKYELDYLTIYDNGYYAPMVDVHFSFKKPIIYGMKPAVTTIYKPTDAAKIMFEYEIRDTSDGSLLATGDSIQVFMDLKYQLVWQTPDFYQKWKEKWL